MEIRKIHISIICSLFVVGLSSCSNSSSSNKSPWESKQEAESGNVVSEEFVEVSMDQPEALNSKDDVAIVELAATEPEIVALPELEALPDFESALVQEPKPVLVEPMSDTLEITNTEAIKDVPNVDNISDIMNVPSSAYAVQVYAGKALANVNKYRSDHGLDYMQIVATERNGEIMHVLVGIYDDRKSAMQASVDVEASTGSKPWVRSITGLQKAAAK